MSAVTNPSAASLLSDFAKVLADTNRTAARLVAEEVVRAAELENHARRLAKLESVPSTLRRRVARLARMETQEAVARVGELDELWEAAIVTFQPGQSVEEQLLILDQVIDAFRSGREMVEAVRKLCAAVEHFGGPVEGVEALAGLQRRIERGLKESTRAHEMRRTPWQPADPERFARGRQEAAEGRVVGPDEARKWFRPTRE